MQNALLLLNQPFVLWSLLAASLALVLIDYLFPVDWLALVGYVLFGVFVGATISTSPVCSLLAAVAVVAVMFVSHTLIFARYLTNAPRHERRAAESAEGDAGSADKGVD